MFDLEREVQSWCRSIHTKGPAREEKVAELMDHLHCEVERLQALGYDLESAFRLATKRMGSSKALVREHSKNTSALGRLVCAAAAWDRALVGRSGRTLTPKRAGLWQLGIALVAAAAILLFSLLLKSSSHADTVTYMILALWWIPFTAITAAAAGKRKGSCAGRERGA